MRKHPAFAVAATIAMVMGMLNVVIVLVEYIINGDNKGYFIEIKNETEQLTLPLDAL